MRSLTKSQLFLAIVAAAPLVAGVYGALHNQVSYTVAPEYFTVFKFRQFALLDSPLPDRVRAAIVGWRASWWMGPPLGLLLALPLLRHRDPRAMARHALRCYGVLLLVTAIAGALGLVVGCVTVQAVDVDRHPPRQLLAGVAHVRRFLCAGALHDATYAGSVAGLACAWIHELLAFARERVTSRDAPVES